MCKKKVLNFLFSHNTGNWTQDVMTELYVQPKAVTYFLSFFKLQNCNFKKLISLFTVFISEVKMLIIALELCISVFSLNMCLRCQLDNPALTKSR